MRFYFVQQKHANQVCKYVVCLFFNIENSRLRNIEACFYAQLPAHLGSNVLFLYVREAPSLCGMNP